MFTIEYSLLNLQGEAATIEQPVLVLPAALTDEAELGSDESALMTCSLDFADKTVVFIDYQIGSGPFLIDLPEIVQTPPNCVTEAPGVELVNLSGAMAQAITLD